MGKIIKYSSSLWRFALYWHETNFLCRGPCEGWNAVGVKERLVNKTSGTTIQAYVPAGERGGAGKVILIVLAVIFALVLLVAGIVGYFVWRVAKAVHTDKNGQMTLSTPGGNFAAGTGKVYTADQLGVDPYPGASSSTGGFDMSTDKGTMVTAVYETSDPASQVVDYYKAKTGLGERSVMDSDNGSVISFKKSDKEVVIITVKSNGAGDGKTQISIMHSKDK